MAQGVQAGAAAWLAVLQARSVVADLLEARLQQEAGVSLAWFEVLLHLAGADGRMRMNQLADGLIVSRSGVTRLIDRMSEDDLVTRISDAHDRRVLYAQITTKGRKALARAIPVHNDAIDELFASHLTDREIDTVRTALAKVISGNGFTEAPCLTTVAQAMKVPATR